MMDRVPPTPRSFTTRATLATLLCSVLPLAGCNEVLGTGQPFESYTFKYGYAEPLGQNAYAVTDPAGTPCPGVPASVSLALLVTVIQNRSDFFGALSTCGGPFLVAGGGVQQVRDNGLFFDYRVTGNNNDALIRANRLAMDNSLTDPRGALISTSGGLTVGSATTLGFAEVYFIDPFKTFRCEQGGPVWADNTNVANATFFEIRLTSQSQADQRAEGEFQCIARNQTDTSDERLLLVTDGTFSMVAR